MDTLDFLFSLNEQAAALKQQPGGLQAEADPGPGKDKEVHSEDEEEEEEEEDGWMINDKNGKSGSGTKKADAYALHETEARRVDKEELIWAPCQAWFKNSSARRYWPAVVRPLSMAAVIPGIEWPIPDDKVLVQYICMIKKINSGSVKETYQVLDKSVCRAYWEDVTISNRSSSSSSSGKKQQQTLSFFQKSPQAKGRWNIESFENLINLVQSKVQINASKPIIDTVRARCNEFLRLALEVVEEGEPDEEVLAARAEEQQAQLERDRAESALQAAIRDRGDANDCDDDDECIIRPGTWLCYQAAMGKHEVYAQVVSVSARELRPVSLTSDYPLDKNSLVRVMRQDRSGACDKLHGTRTRPLREFRLEDGRSRTLRGAGEASERDAAKSGIISSRHLYGPSGATKAGGADEDDGEEDEGDQRGKDSGSDDEVEIVSVTQPRGGSRVEEGKLLPRKTAESPKKPSESPKAVRSSPKRSPAASPSKASESSLSPPRKKVAASPSPSANPKRGRPSPSPKSPKSSSSDIYSSAQSASESQS